MKKRLFTIFATLFLFIILSSCKRISKNSTGCVIDSIQVSYFNDIRESPISIKFGDIKRAKSVSFKEIRLLNSGRYRIGVIDSTINDQKVLKEIEKEIKRLIPSNELTFKDARAIAVVYFNNKTQSHILLGGTYASNLYYNDKYQKRSNKLIYLLKKSTGYYCWFAGSLNWMEELKDTTFNHNAIK